MAELAHLVDEPTRRVLEKAIELGTVIVALSIEDRERILRALEDAPTDALAELRAVLLREHEWRVRVGLAKPDFETTLSGGFCTWPPGTSQPSGKESAEAVWPLTYQPRVAATGRLLPRVQTWRLGEGLV